MEVPAPVKSRGRVYLVYGSGRRQPCRRVCPQSNIAPADMLCTLKSCHFVILVYLTLSILLLHRMKDLSTSEIALKTNRDFYF